MKARTIFKEITSYVFIIVMGLSIGVYATPIYEYAKDLTLQDQNLEISMQYESKAVLFGKDSCPFCIKGKEFLNKNNIDWVYVNIEDESNMKLFEDLDELGVPVLILNKKRIRGFDENTWKKTFNVN